MSEVHIYLIRVLRPTAHASSFLTHFTLSLFAFPSAGAVDKIVFPEGMQTVDFCYCCDLTGSPELGMNEVIFI